MIESFTQFMQLGGEVLILIAMLTFMMWVFIFERIWFYFFESKREMNKIIALWHDRKDHHSWASYKVRLQLISQNYLMLQEHLPIIRTMVALCPLLGLLGTVWGMIDVFNVLSLSNGADIKQMAAGVSKATIPTMAGMVAALSGLFASSFLAHIAKSQLSLLESALLLDR
jgi:biopolymer transport protein ExbB